MTRFSSSSFFRIQHIALATSMKVNFKFRIFLLQIFRIRVVNQRRLPRRITINAEFHSFFTSLNHFFYSLQNLHGVKKNYEVQHTCGLSRCVDFGFRISVFLLLLILLFLAFPILVYFSHNFFHDETF